MRHIILLFVVILINCLITVNNEKKIKKSKFNNDEELKDIIASNFNNYAQYDNIINIMVSCMLIWAVLVVLKGNLFNNFIKNVITILVLRCIANYSIILPKNNKKCIAENNTFLEKLMVGSCNDKIFSGHTAMTLLSVIYLIKVILTCLSLRNILRDT